MSDVKVFRVDGDRGTELPAQGAQVERSLQKLFEANLEVFLGIRFLATEYSTGPVHGGRIDTLGIDEDGSPVIIEYKRAMNENVINQGLFYLDWLLDHRREFQWLVMEVLGKEAAETVEWSSPRLLCIAGDFTRYDAHAVKQIARNIELLRHRRFGDDLLMIELVHAPQAVGRPAAISSRPTAPAPVADDAVTTSIRIAAIKDPRRSDDVSYRVEKSPSGLRDIWDAAISFIQGLGDDVQVKELKLYYAFKRLRNFVCLEVYPTTRTVVAYLKIDPDGVAIEPGFTRDMRGVGHFGTGDLQVTMTTFEDVTRAGPLFQQAYDNG